MSQIISSKLICLLRTFKQTELRDFDLWLRSPWCNTNKNLVRLLEKIQKYHPHFDSPKLDKEKLFRQVLPNGKYSDRRMNNLLSEGYLAAKQFLIFQRFSKNTSLQKQLLLEEFQGRYLDDWFFRNLQKEIERLEAKEIKEWEEELDLFRLYRRLYQHPNQEPRMQVGQKTIVRMDEQLQLLYLLEKGAIINEKLWRNRILQDEHHDVASEKEQWQQLSEPFSQAAFDLYRLRFAEGKEDRIHSYQVLRKTLTEQFERLNKKEQKSQLLSLLNDTMQLVKAGEISITESLPLYELGLKSGSLFNQGKLTRNTFTSIVVISNTSGSFTFTEHFINTYLSYVDQKISADCYHWAKVHTAYWKKKLKECLVILQNYDFKVPHFQLLSRVLRAQVYFDLYLQDRSYRLFLFSHLDAFEKWLSREKTWSSTNKRTFIHFVQKCRTLAKYYGDLEFEAAKVEQVLEGTQAIQALNWLHQKQEEILRLRA